ncbi:MAG TPA: PfkB family carbohydrate kinase, partial [Gemmataceae bacterium]|nr:PfkB family carbohydrate kinase [Gemmataceae bacterium]
CARARAEQVATHGERILDLTGARIAAVTLDSEGAIFFEKGCPPYRTYACPVRSARSAGAGDTFVAALALGLTAGASTATAAELASAAAAIVVGKDATAACSSQELREYLSAEGKHITDRQRLADRCEFYRAQGKRIVFTNGCFDILHRGIQAGCPTEEQPALFVSSDGLRNRRRSRSRIVRAACPALISPSRCRPHHRRDPGLHRLRQGVPVLDDQRQVGRFAGQERQAGRQVLVREVGSLIVVGRCGGCPLVFKTSGRLEESRQWVRFPYTPVLPCSELHFLDNGAV